MVRYIDSKKMGRGKHGWLDSHFHFSFAEYYNPDNMHFGELRVVNDDMVQPGTGFDTHPHKNMEIISYVVNGELTHADSMKNQRKLTRGQVQYMSAGTGVLHSEHNFGRDLLRFLQIWIFPDKDGYEPNYGDYAFKWEERKDAWLPIATGDASKKDVPIHVHADVNVYASEISAGKELQLKVAEDRQAYLVLIEGKAEIEGHTLSMRDAMEIVGQDVTVKASEDAHVLVIEMAKEN